MSGQKNQNSSAGCLIAILICVVAFGLPLVAALYDEGVFDGKPTGSPYDPVFGARESGRLAERLAAANRTQNICYGWEIDSGRSFVNEVTPIYSGTFTPAPTPPAAVRRQVTDDEVEVGSNLGVGIDPRDVPDRCPRWVIFTADYFYSSIDEEWTSVTTDVKTNLGITISGSDLIDIGLPNQQLLGDNAGARLADAVGALPVLVAEKGGAPPVTEAPAAQPPAAGDKLSGPGAGRYIVMGVAIILIAGGLAWMIAAAVRSRRSGS